MEGSGDSSWLTQTQREVEEESTFSTSALQNVCHLGFQTCFIHAYGQQWYNIQYIYCIYTHTQSICVRIYIYIFLLSYIVSMSIKHILHPLSHYHNPKNKPKISFLNEWSINCAWWFQLFCHYFNHCITNEGIIQENVMGIISKNNGNCKIGLW